MSETLIVIVARQGIALTKQTVNSALKQHPPCDVLLVSNHCTDGTDAWASTKNIARITFQKQVSLSACWNAALRAAWRMKYKAVILSNNDVLYRSDFSDLLFKHGTEFVSCVSVASEEQLGIPGDRTVEDLRKSERDHPDFSNFLIRKSVTDKVGFFNEDYYPGYAEDSEFHVRAWRAGVRLLCVDLPFVHFGASTLKQASDREAVVIRRGAEKNRLRFKAKYGCLPGTPEYEKLFSPDQFGIDNRRIQCVACGSRDHVTSLCPINNAAMAGSTKPCLDCAKIAKNFAWPQWGNGVHLQGCSSAPRPAL
jgi:GT2 family glycosyltransferase